MGPEGRKDSSPEHFDGAVAAPAASSTRSGRSETRRTRDWRRARRCPCPWRRKTCRCSPSPPAAIRGATFCARNRRSRSGCCDREVTSAEAEIVRGGIRGSHPLRVPARPRPAPAACSPILQYNTVPAHLLMTISPSRVVLGDVRTLVAVSGRGRHLRVGARPPPREHLKMDETMVRKCAC